MFIIQACVNVCVCVRVRVSVLVCLHTYYDRNARNARVSRAPTHTPTLPCGFASCNVRRCSPYGRGALPAQRDIVRRRGMGRAGTRFILWESVDVSLSTESTHVFVYVSEISGVCLHLTFVCVCGPRSE